MTDVVVFSIDLMSLVYIIIAIPIVILFCRIAWSYAVTIKQLTQNKYVSNLIEENNKVWREYFDLQREYRELKDKELE